MNWSCSYQKGDVCGLKFSQQCCRKLNSFGMRCYVGYFPTVLRTVVSSSWPKQSQKSVPVVLDAEDERATLFQYVGKYLMTRLHIPEYMNL
jgi:hypothetical protein